MHVNGSPFFNHYNSEHDENMILADISVGWPGSAHDSQISKNSNLFRKDLADGSRQLTTTDSW